MVKRLKIAFARYPRYALVCSILIQIVRRYSFWKQYYEFFLTWRLDSKLAKQLLRNILI